MRWGVTRYKDKWRADVKSGDRVSLVGVFGTKEEAEKAYVAAQIALHKKRNNLVG